MAKPKSLAKIQWVNGFELELYKTATAPDFFLLLRFTEKIQLPDTDSKTPLFTLSITNPTLDKPLEYSVRAVSLNTNSINESLIILDQVNVKELNTLQGQQVTDAASIEITLHGEAGPFENAPSKTLSQKLLPYQL